MNKPKNYRYKKLRCCWTCKDCEIGNGYWTCKRDEDNIMGDSGCGFQYEHICDYYKPLGKINVGVV